MKRIVAMVLAVLMVVTLTACSNKVKDIDGILTGYVQVGEYIGPLAVIEDNGKTYYLATSLLKFAGEVEQTGVRTKSWTMPIGRVFVYTPAD